MLPYTYDADDAFHLDKNTKNYVLHGKFYYLVEGFDGILKSACVL